MPTTIHLSSLDIARAITAYLACHGYTVQGANTLRINGEFIEGGTVFVDPSAQVYLDDASVSQEHIRITAAEFYTKHAPPPPTESWIPTPDDFDAWGKGLIMANDALVRLDRFFAMMLEGAEAMGPKYAMMADAMRAQFNAAHSLIERRKDSTAPLTGAISSTGKRRADAEYREDWMTT